MQKPQTLRVQVPNYHTLSKIVTYITTILNPNTYYWILWTLGETSKTSNCEGSKLGPKLRSTGAIIRTAKTNSRAPISFSVEPLVGCRVQGKLAQKSSVASSVDPKTLTKELFVPQGYRVAFRRAKNRVQETEFEQPRLQSLRHLSPKCSHLLPRKQTFRV